MKFFNKKQPDAKSGASLKLRVIGLGGAGCHIAETLHGVGLGGDADFFAINADSQALEDCRVENKFALGSKVTGGLGTGGEPDRGRVAAMEDIEDLESLCKDCDLIFLIAGLGGGTGTGAAPLIAAAAKKAGALVLAVVTLPFDCEGTRRREQAAAGMHELQKTADGVICLPNQMVFKLINGKTTLVETFKTTNEYVAQGVRAIWKLVSETGLINVDFADLCALIRGREANSSFATVEASGPHRVRDAVDRLLNHPLLGEGETLPEAEAVLVSLCGSSDLSMADVDRVMELLTRNCGNAQIKLGAAVDDSMGDRISVTLVAASKPKVTTPPTALEEEANRLDGAGDNGLSVSTFVGKPAERNSTAETPQEEEPEEPTVTTPPVRAWRTRRKRVRVNHPQLPLDLIPKGRFEKSEPTVRNGEDLDVPTFVRRGLVLN